MAKSGENLGGRVQTAVLMLPGFHTTRLGKGPLLSASDPEQYQRRKKLSEPLLGLEQDDVCVPT